MFPETDEEGYMTKPDAWTPAVAVAIAQGVMPEKLGEKHWKVIDYLRNYYLQYNAVPPVRMLCQRCDIDAPYLRKLFPCGLIKGACKIAGLPGSILKGLLYP